MKVVVFSHGHPTFSKGGGELAAYYLYQGINALPVHDAWFIGRGSPDVLNRFPDLASVAEGEYLMAGNAGMADLTATTALEPDSDLGQLLRAIQPDMVHFHHYVHLGIELVRLVKNVCPAARIVMTLHEYMAICMNQGQMVTTDGNLCYQAGPRECHRCFPDVNPEDIFLRERYIKTFFDLVDRFVSPSRFLRDRYIQWGLAPERINVIENGLPEGVRIPPRELDSGAALRGRFGYFGQITPFKGIDVILEAFLRLPKVLRKRVTLDIFGAGLGEQPLEIQENLAGLLKKGKDMFRLHGPYEPHEQGRLMAEIDWVVLGSKWWENSPLVIQEAFKYGRPLITPDIGGMAEKVQDGQGGLNYRAKDSVALASVIKRAAEEPGLFDQLHGSLPAYSGISQISRRHIALYEEILEEGAA